MWGVLAALTVATIGALVVGAEAFMRVRAAEKYGSTETVEDLYSIDPASGLRVPVPGSHFGGRLTINRLGFRGPELAVPKPPHSVRIAFLGASTTWCAEVSSDEKAWPSLVVDQLRLRFPRARLDFVNAGVPGYTVTTSLRNLDLRVAQLRPDIIVIYHATNDMSAELRALAKGQGIIRDLNVAERSWLARQSLLWDLAEKNLRLVLARQGLKEKAGRLEVDTARLGEQFRRDLLALVAASKAVADRVALATFSVQLRHGQSVAQQKRASASALYYMPFMTPEALIQAYARYNDIIREVATETGALLIEGEDEIPGDAAHFNDSVHFKDAGSERMAERVSNALASDRRVAQALAGAVKGL
jgi:lysophospholipase L1-like esterase